MSLRDAFIYVDVSHRREEKMIEAVAWQTAILGAWIGVEPVPTMNGLLGRPEEAPDPTAFVEAFDRIMGPLSRQG